MGIRRRQISSFLFIVGAVVCLGLPLFADQLIMDKDEIIESDTVNFYFGYCENFGCEDYAPITANVGFSSNGEKQVVYQIRDWDIPVLKIDFTALVGRDLDEDGCYETWFPSEDLGFSFTTVIENRRSCEKFGWDIATEILRQNIPTRHRSEFRLAKDLYTRAPISHAVMNKRVSAFVNQQLDLMSASVRLNKLIQEQPEARKGLQYLYENIAAGWGYLASDAFRIKSQWSHALGALVDGIIILVAKKIADKIEKLYTARSEAQAAAALMKSGAPGVTTPEGIAASVELVENFAKVTGSDVIAVTARQAGAVMRARQAAAAAARAAAVKELPKPVEWAVEKATKKAVSISIVGAAASYIVGQSTSLNPAITTSARELASHNILTSLMKNQRFMSSYRDWDLEIPQFDDIFQLQLSTSRLKKIFHENPEKLHRNMTHDPEVVLYLTNKAITHFLYRRTPIRHRGNSTVHLVVTGFVTSQTAKHAKMKPDDEIEEARETALQEFRAGRVNHVRTAATWDARKYFQDRAKALGARELLYLGSSVTLINPEEIAPDYVNYLKQWLKKYQIWRARFGMCRPSLKDRIDVNKNGLIELVGEKKCPPELKEERVERAKELVQEAPKLFMIPVYGPAA